MYRILVTGAGGFVGKNLIAALECIRDGKDRVHKLAGMEPGGMEILAYDRTSTKEELDAYCQKADFVFHLAGVNRPKEPGEFMAGNCGFTSELLDMLKKHRNACPVMYASSIQASGVGRYEGSPYGSSKLAGEELVFRHERETGARVLVYRFPNLFGKWCRPNYNSVVATFCHQIANDLPIRISDPDTELTLLYIDDLTEEMLLALNGGEHRCGYAGLQEVARKDGRYCFVPTVHKASPGRIAALLESFRAQPGSLMLPEIPEGSFEKKLFSTYLSYLPEEKALFPLEMKADGRGSFTELLKTKSCGQFSVNISKPGVTKGQHWHHSKWEFFVVVSGHARIQERKLGVDEHGQPYPVMTFEVSGEKLEAVYMLPGYAHNIQNLSDTRDLVTLMWASEPFEEARPDTYREPV
ncbi:MAG: NAD-dependent epimerase/dehydratase family protein [Muribaculaceae bacterium]|nr:NAD-dependent epimerase/dehydratase family protein [Roseburia sp.]MCM1431214.1 NAD-dependent epimerase/dehydratase family protein [Muribaculaceae bacterium]MCM1492300.1 NAD-dependent epimerase/dehydratase family protein [Muribaculaceae bacterium]